MNLSYKQQKYENSIKDNGMPGTKRSTNTVKVAKRKSSHKTKATKDRWLLNLSGQGNQIFSLIEKDLWDWVMSDDMGQRPENKGHSSWEDQLTPQKVKDHYDSAIHITAGSWQNDRALFCPLKVEFDSVHDLMDYCKKHKIKIVDEYQGRIY